MSVDLAARTRTPAAEEHRFIREVLATVGVGDDDARDVADVLLAADLRGIESHGIARLRHFYFDRITRGAIDPVAKPTIVRETPTSLAFDAHNGLGHPPAKAAMAQTIAKARANGLAFTTVRNSNHFGIAGYYAMMALEHDVIGIASTDSIHYGAPTFGSQKKFGTNPFAFAIPAGDEPPFVLDFATTAVTFGKLEVYARMGKRLLPGWAVDVHGAPTDDPAQASPAGALLPLGGFGTASGGHKGFGLGLMCEILCGVLAGAAFGPELSISDATSGGGHVGHFFGALRIDAIRDLAGFKADMDRELRAFRTSAPSAGHDRVRVAGDPERENEFVNRRDGVPHLPKVWEVVDGLAAEFGITPMQKC
jgi:L-2-hydroxycarboxylate dehydrogenase (NAD+)